MSKFQTGITNRPPEHALFFALNIAAPDPAAARETVELLRELVRKECRSDLDETTPASAKDQPSAETGELDFADDYDRYRLTVTVGFGKSGYDKLGVTPAEQPQDLVPIPWDKLSDVPQKAENGDLLLQVCSDSVYIVEHVQRRIEEELGDRLQTMWAIAGTQRHNSRSGRVSREEGRALIGFKDGTSNLNPRRSPADAELVFVDPAKVGDYPPQMPLIPPGQPNPYGGGAQPPTFPSDLRPPPTTEPEWTENGSYVVLRASTIRTPDWDRRTLGEQEKTVGRWKVSGSALDQPDDPNSPPADPNFAADPDGNTTPHTAHIRKVHPRGPGGCGTGRSGAEPHEQVGLHPARGLRAAWLGRSVGTMMLSHVSSSGVAASTSSTPAALPAVRAPSPRHSRLRNRCARRATSTRWTPRTTPAVFRGAPARTLRRPGSEAADYLHPRRAAMSLGSRASTRERILPRALCPRMRARRHSDVPGVAGRRGLGTASLGIFPPRPSSRCRD